MDRSLALSLVIGGTVGNSLRTAVGNTIAQVGRVSQAVRDAERQKATVLKESAALDKTGRQIDSYRQLGREVLEAGQAHRAAQDKVKGLAREIAASDAPTKTMEKALAAARREVVRTAAAEEAKKQRLGALRAELKAAGIDTQNLGAAQRKLASDMAASKARIDETTHAIKRQEDAMARMEKRQELMGQMGKTAAVVGAAWIALSKPVKEAGDFEHQLRRFGNTAGLTGKQLEDVRLRVRHVSTAVRQGREDLLTGVDVLVGKGMKPDQALAAIEPIGRAATATGASMEDMANLSYSVMANLHVPVSKLGTAMDMMAQAGKEGGFELKHMAQQFPQLTSSAAKLGLTGTEAVASLGAMLQVAMKGASDPSTAANNLANFLGKITSPEAKKNFEKMGVDIEQALADGVAAGKNPVEVAMQEIADATGADLNKVMGDAFDENGKLVEGAADKISESFKLGELFGDKQVQDFLAPMLANYGEYLKIKQKALGATGVVDQDFANMAGTFNKASERLGTAWSNIKEGVGASLLPIITPMTNSLAAAAEVTADLTEKFPMLTAAVVVGGGGFLAFRTGTLALRYGMTFLRGGMGAVGREALNVGRSSTVAGAGISRLGGATTATTGRVGAAIARLRQYAVAANAAAKASNQLAGAQGGIGDLAGLGRGGLGKVGRGLRMGGKALGGAGLLISAGFAASDLMDPNTSKEDKGGAIGNLAGGMAGAAAGAAIGSIVPIVGTALGAVLGGALGAFGGEKLGALIGREGVGQTVGGAMAATVAAVPAMAGNSPSPQTPPAIVREKPPLPAPNVQNTFHIIIQAQPGQDTRQIGEEVRRQLDQHFQQIGARQRAGLYDGG